MASRKMITAVEAAKLSLLVHVFVRILMFVSRNLATADPCVIPLSVSLCVVSVFACCSGFYCINQPYMLKIWLFIALISESGGVRVIIFDNNCSCLNTALHSQFTLLRQLHLPD